MKDNEVNKRQLQGIIDYCCQYVTEVDQQTLKQLTAFVNIDGSHGTINHIELCRRMSKLVQYSEDCCSHTLGIVLDLLGVPTPNNLPTSQMTEQFINISYSSLPAPPTAVYTPMMRR